MDEKLTVAEEEARRLVFFLVDELDVNKGGPEAFNRYREELVRRIECAEVRGYKKSLSEMRKVNSVTIIIGLFTIVFFLFIGIFYIFNGKYALAIGVMAFAMALLAYLEAKKKTDQL